MKSVKDLTLLEINKLIAKAQGVEVVEHEYAGKIHCAIESEFNPDYSCNHYDLHSFKMWTWFEPTNDWTLIGPIIDQHRIFISHSTDKDEHYSWAYCCDEDGNELYEIEGDTPQEAAAKVYVRKVYGRQIDLDNMPAFKWTAKVRVLGFQSRDESDEMDFVDMIYNVEASSWQEAIRIVKQNSNPPKDSKIDFVEWVKV